MSESSDDETYLGVTILVDKKKNKVLYAEVDRDSVDILFSFLTLPLGTIVRLIGKTQPDPLKQLGSFGALYESVRSLEYEYFNDPVLENMLMRPRSSSENLCRGLKVNVDDTDAKFFMCPNSECHKFVSIYKHTRCPNNPLCSSYMSTVKSLEDSTHSSKVFVTKASKFLITDALQVTPVHPGIAICLLGNLSIDDTSVIEERTVELCLDEFLELLNYTLVSTAPLTDLFISKKNLSRGFVLQKPSLLTAKNRIDKSLEDRKIEVKALMKKSTNEFLFVEAYQDFIDFLFSFLLVPLGKMLHIMDGQSCAGSVDGLYKSVQSLDSQYFTSEDRKDSLLEPKLPPIFKRENHLFPLESAPFRCLIEGRPRKMPVHSRLVGVEACGGFLCDESVFLVLDNLEVIPFCTASVISVLSRNNVSISGVEERTLSIGVFEGISIMRAALNSSSAISKGLGLQRKSPVMRKSKQEK